MFIFGVDPGSKHNGVAIYELDIYGDIISITTHEIEISKVKVTMPFRRPIQVQIDYIYKEFLKLIIKYKPIHVVFESGFINPQRLGSIIPLTKALGVMELAIMQVDNPAGTTVLAPREAKRKLGVVDHKDKDSVTEALLRVEDIVKFVNPYTVSEHVNDALMLGYIAVRDIQKNLSSIMINRQSKWQ